MWVLYYPTGQDVKRHLTLKYSSFSHITHFDCNNSDSSFAFQEKCHQYWPAERSARYQYFVVDPMAEYNMPQYILREFKVTDARVSTAQPTLYSPIFISYYCSEIASTGQKGFIFNVHPIVHCFNTLCIGVTVCQVADSWKAEARISVVFISTTPCYIKQNTH